MIDLTTLSLERLLHGHLDGSWDAVPEVERRIAAAVADEREACAEIAEREGCATPCSVPDTIAADIRARP